MDKDEKIKKTVEQLMREMAFKISQHDVEVLTEVEPLARMLLDNPRQAISSIRKTYDKSLDAAYTDENGKNQRAFIECVAGGPLETIPWAIYRSIGAAYPYMDRKNRDEALGQLLSIFDGRNYAEVNGMYGAGHTPGIREPLLLADIAIARGIYWPGLHDDFDRIKKDYPSFFEFQKEVIGKDGLFNPQVVNSDFLLAYAVLRNDFCDWGEQYVQVAEPDFLERTMKGIVALRFGKERNQNEIAAGEARLREFLPQSLHSKIIPLREAADWVDYRKFP